MTSFKKLASLLPLAVLLASYAAATPVKHADEAPPAGLLPIPDDNTTRKIPVQIHPPSGTARRLPEMNGPTAHLSAGLPHSQPPKPVAMYHKHGGPIRRFSDTHHQVEEGLLDIQKRFKLFDGCFESFLSTFSTPNPGCASAFDQAKERDVRQRFQQVKQTTCDLQKDLEDLKTLDTQNLDGGEAYRRRLEVIRNRLTVLRTNNQELFALLRTLASRFGLSNIFNGLGAAGQSGGVAGAGGQSSQGGTGSQTGTGGSTGTGATDGATQNASSGGSGVLLDINASSNPQSGTVDTGATVSNGAGGDTSGTAGSPLIDISVNAP